MSNQLEKLKNSIKKEYTKNFELNLMKTSGFIPVDKRQNEFYVILNKTQLSNRQKVEGIIKDKYNGIIPRFIPVESMEFEELFKIISSDIVEANNEGSDENTNINEPTAEEMLVGIGWLTQAQLEECISLAEERNLPLDAIFKEKDYLSYERIVSYLKKKYGVSVISKSNIVVDTSILKLLPEDFIKRKQTIIMSMEENKLAVAMVNPTDKYTIREISLSTGRPLNVY